MLHTLGSGKGDMFVTEAAGCWPRAAMLIAGANYCQRVLWSIVLFGEELPRYRDDAIQHLPPWLSGLAISGRGAVKAWLAIRQGVGSYPTPAGMSSQVSA